MEYSFNQLKKKTVIDVTDGSKIGKVTDITVSFPECCLVNMIVSPLFCLSSSDKTVITPCDIEKIGEDAILIRKRKIVPRPSSDDEE